MCTQGLIACLVLARTQILVWVLGKKCVHIGAQFIVPGMVSGAPSGTLLKSKCLVCWVGARGEGVVWARGGGLRVEYTVMDKHSN